MIEGVLDSSALLAWFRAEPGGEEVRKVIGRAAISSVNLAEVVTKLIEFGHDRDEAVEVVRDFPCEVIAFDTEMALLTGALRAETKRHGLSLGDRACLALAMRERCPALTTDRAWAQLEVGVEIRMLR